MRILYFIPNCSGGMFHYSTQLINNVSNHVSKNENKVSVIVNNCNSKLLTEDVEIEKIPINKKTLLTAHINIFSFIKNYNPDIIHFTDFHYLLAPLILYIKKHNVIITAHDVSLHPGSDTLINNLFLKIYLGMGDRIIVHGDEIKNKLLDKGFKECDIVVIPHGEYSFFKSFNNDSYESKEASKILFFGRILDYKGLDWLLRAMKIINEHYPHQKLVIAGDGNLDQYLPLISQLNEQNVEIHNYYIPDEDVYKFFETASVVVLPYIEASQSGIIPIAYSFRKPVVATKVGAIPDVVIDGKTGFLVPPKDENALAESIVTLLQNDQLRIEMGEAGYRFSIENLSWGNIAKKHMDLYKNLSPR